MTKTIKHIKGNGDFTNDYGTFYSFEYEFEDTDIFLANHKTQQSPFKVGDVVELEEKGRTKDGTSYGKLSKPQNSTGNYANYKKSGQGSIASFSAAYAKDLEVAFINNGKEFNIDRLLQNAERINTWLSTK